MAEQDDVENLYKVLIIGDVNTGKTSLVKQYVHKIFPDNYKSTIGVDFALKVVNLKDADGSDIEVKLQLWDIAGQERFGNMTRVYYKRANAAFIVFDLTKPASFEDVRKWKADLDDKIWLPNGDKLPVVLLANKCDLQPAKMFAEGGTAIEDLCREINILKYFEVSAKEGTNVEDAAMFLIDHLLTLGVVHAPPADNVLDASLDSEAGGGGGCC